MVDYPKYIEYQKEKTTNHEKRKRWLGEEWKPKVMWFKGLFEKYDFLKNCQSALCVAARTGQEVKALQDMGITATGIDIVPCEPLVKEGDMHDIPYPDNSFDFVFSNSYDHALYPEKMASEMERVAKKYITLHLAVDSPTDKYTVTRIKKSQEAIKHFKKSKVIKDKSMIKKHGLNWEVCFQL